MSPRRSLLVSLCGVLVAAWPFLVVLPGLADEPAKGNKPGAKTKEAADDERPFVIVTDEAKAPANPRPRQPELLVRPVVGQQFYIFVHNPSEDKQTVTVQLDTGSGNPLSSKPLALNGKSTGRAIFPRGAADAKPTALPGPNFRLQVKLATDNDWTPVTIKQRVPSQYIKLNNIQFTPATADRPNRLVVEVKAEDDLNPPCKVELVLRPDRLPTLREAERVIAAPTLLRRQGQTVELVAQNLQFKPGVQGDGEFYLNIDGYPRALVYRTNLGSPAEFAYEPLRTARVHLSVPSRYAKPGEEMTAGVEVDDPTPQESPVAAGIDRNKDGNVSPEQPFPARRDIQATLDPVGPEGELKLNLTAQDWTWKPKTRGLRGDYVLRAWLTDKQATPGQARVVFIDAPPGGIAFVGKPVRDLKTGKLKVAVRVTDPPDWVRDVTFFVGKPVDGKVPAEAARIPGVQPDERVPVWTAEVPIPADRRDPLDIGAVIVNKVDATAVSATTYVPRFVGTIVGVVYEADRPQKGLKVTCVRNPQPPGGKELVTETNERGEYVFPDLEPGTYIVTSAKVAAFTRSDRKDITIAADQEKKVDLNLMQR